MFLMLHVTCSCIFHAYIPFFFFFSIFFILIVFGAFLLLSLSLSFYSVSLHMGPKHKSTPSQNPVRSRASYSSSPVDSTPFYIRFCNENARTNFSKYFSRHGIHSERQVFLLDFSNTDLPTIIYSKGWKSLCSILVTCPSVIIQEFYSNMHKFDYSVPHFFTCVQDTCIVVTPDLISEVLHIPRVKHPDYRGSDHLKTVSKGKLLTLFCETPSSWGDRQNTPCKGFTKGLRFLNMVMTFAFHPLSH